MDEAWSATLTPPPVGVGGQVQVDDVVHDFNAVEEALSASRTPPPSDVLDATVAQEDVHDNPCVLMGALEIVANAQSVEDIGRTVSLEPLNPIPEEPQEGHHEGQPDRPLAEDIEDITEGQQDSGNEEEVVIVPTKETGTPSTSVCPSSPQLEVGPKHVIQAFPCVHSVLASLVRVRTGRDNHPRRGCTVSSSGSTQSTFAGSVCFFFVNVVCSCTCIVQLLC